MFEKDDCVNVDATSSTKTALSYANKLALMASSVSAVSLLPVAAAQAAIVHTSGSPVSVAIPNVAGFSSSDWDIDGNGSVDFQLGAEKLLTGGSYGYFTFNSGFMGLFGNPVNGVAITLASSPFIATSSASVGASLVFNGYNFVVGTFSSVFTSVVGNWSSFTQPNGAFFGFRFTDNTIGNPLKYGWARASLNLNGARPSFTINEWAYEDDGSSIHVPDTSSAAAVPTPSLALGVLSMGAASIRRWRKQKRELQAASGQQSA